MSTTEMARSFTDEETEAALLKYEIEIPDSPAGLFLDEFNCEGERGADVYNTGLWCWLSWYKTASCCAW